MKQNKPERSFKKKLLSLPVVDIELKKNMRVSDLIKSMDSIGGFTGQHMVDGIKIIRMMTEDKESFNFLSFPADIVSTGLRGVLAGAVKYFDAIITTCGTFDHDIARAEGGKYTLGSFDVDDAMLHKHDVYRLGNIFIGYESYGMPIEKKFKEVMSELYKTQPDKKEYSPSELAFEFGKRIKDKNSILRQAYLHGVKVYTPGIVDGAFGTQLTIFSQGNDFKLNMLKDEIELSNISFDNKVTGALMIGGGISKHHVIWWNQFKGGLDYAAYITTATQFDGSLSGARLTEAVSWGKVKEKAKYVTIDGDATALLPLMFAAIDIV